MITASFSNVIKLEVLIVLLQAGASVMLHISVLCRFVHSMIYNQAYRLLTIWKFYICFILKVSETILIHVLMRIFTDLSAGFYSFNSITYLEFFAIFRFIREYSIDFRSIEISFVGKCCFTPI